jgi:hypothetical protein
MSGASSRRKGYTWEAAVVTWLRSKGWHGAERAASGAPSDILGCHITIECKSHKTLDLAGWVDQAAKAAALRPGDRQPHVVVVKRRGKTVSDAYAVTSMEVFAQLLTEAGYNPGQVQA